MPELTVQNVMEDVYNRKYRGVPSRGVTNPPPPGDNRKSENEYLDLILRVDPSVANIVIFGSVEDKERIVRYMNSKRSDLVQRTRTRHEDIDHGIREILDHNDSMSYNDYVIRTPELILWLNEPDNMQYALSSKHSDVIIRKLNIEITYIQRADTRPNLDTIFKEGNTITNLTIDDIIRMRNRLQRGLDLMIAVAHERSVAAQARSVAAQARGVAAQARGVAAQARGVAAQKHENRYKRRFSEGEGEGEVYASDLSSKRRKITYPTSLSPPSTPSPSPKSPSHLSIHNKGGSRDKYTIYKKQMSRKNHEQFNKLNAIHPKNQTPKEKYEFFLLLGKTYLGKSSRKTKKYTQNQKKFYRDQ